MIAGTGKKTKKNPRLIGASVKFKLKWKIFLFLLCFCGLLLLILWLFQVVFLDSFYKAVKIGEIKGTASSIAKNINYDGLSENIEKLSQSNDVCIDLLQSDGTALFSSDILRDCVIHKLSADKKAQLYQNALQNGGEFMEYVNKDDFMDKKVINDIAPKEPPDGRLPPQGGGFFGGGGMQSIVYSKIIKTASGKELAVLINCVITPVNATVNTLRWQIYFITGFMLLVAVMLALMIAKHVSKPIEKINESAKALAKGNYDISFKASGYKEISELSDTLNYTAGELSKVEHLRRELIANISHDLRTPLTLISGYAEAMIDIPDEMNSENVRIIIDETSRLTSLVNDVLDISRLENGSSEISAKCYSLTQSIQKAVTSMSELLKKDGYSISFEYDTQINITADETKISQAFYNLLINAVNYTGEDKKIVVRQLASHMKNSNSVRIEVEDSGAGISEQEIPYIWDRYYKADKAQKTHKRAVTGTGLGLSIVKNIIKLHNGEYGVEKAVSGGSVFWFKLKK